MVAGTQREVRHLLYRCQGCKRVITKCQLIAAWERAEASGVDQKGVCVCGGGRINPTNASIFEELTSPAIWVLWWRDVVVPWLRKKVGR